MSLENDKEIFADFVKSQEGKHIRKEDNYYIVSRQIKGKEVVFGKFTDLECAKEYERKLIIHGWVAYFSPYVSPYGKYIVKQGRKFYVLRAFSGKKHNFGSFYNLEDAIRRREELIDDNWGKKKAPKPRVKHDENIFFSFNTYKIIREIDGEKQFFGKYDSYEDAIAARKILEKSDWNIEMIPESLISSYEFIKHRQFLRKWEIVSVIDDTFLSFGLFDTRENARKALDILRKNDWNTAYVPLEYFAENYGIKTNRRKSGTFYTVVRRINERVVGLANFDNIEDAIEYRNRMHFSNWEIEEPEEELKYDENIYPDGDKVVVRKDGVVYGVFDNVFDAVDFRLECIKRNWRMDDL